MGSQHNLAAAVSILSLLATPSSARDEAPAQQQEFPPSIRYEANISAGGVAPAGANLRNPYKGDQKSAETGAGLFVSMNCDGCHGGGAVGWVGPSLADARWRYGGADDEIFQSIYYGRPKGMPAYGGVLGPEGIWMLVTYLQSLSVPENVPTQSWDEMSKP
jgi:mono/diheme cytochrome c family protein